MNKGTKKAEYNQHNVDAITALVEKFGLSAYYIRQSVNGNRNGVVPDKIRKEYKEICKQLDDAKTKAVENFKKQ
ncbi:hypothetical protein [Chryseobacterium sp.]|uniref:hypothetical protein n=1 Tax=Chryseobacterium sp. TaxID=1871047 RepID=UPI0012A888E9|nr:hypothetical protein [Chryseobacterium sp.]QFG53675.1 hypothetical protein F7R58_08950 [Chryseobacterium sp.]